MPEKSQTMSLDEAIKHCYEVVENGVCAKCEAEHLQLASWLEELKRLREENSRLIRDIGQFM